MKSQGYSKVPLSPISIPCQFYRLIVVQIEAAASAEAEKEKERKARRGKAGAAEMIVSHLPCLSLLIAHSFTFPPKEVALRRAREWEVLKSAKEAFEEEEEARAALLRLRGGERAVRGEVRGAVGGRGGRGGGAAGRGLFTQFLLKDPQQLP